MFIIIVISLAKQNTMYKDLTISIELLTDDPVRVEQINSYLEHDSKGQFTTPVKKIAEKYNIPQKQLLEEIKPLFWVTDQSCYCRNCTKCLKKYNVRSDLFINLDRQNICDDCTQEKINQEKEKQRNKLLSGFENLVHRTLSQLDYEIFVHLCQDKLSRNQIANQLGLSYKSLENKVRFFKEINLLYSEYGSDIQIVPEYKALFESYVTTKKVRSIFGSKPNFHLYKELLKKYPFVYPEIPICAFLDINLIKQEIPIEYFNYLKSARVDFAVCDSDGIPLFVIEFQGSGHENEDQKRKDEIKLKAVELSGIPLHYYAFNKVTQKAEPIS